MFSDHKKIDAHQPQIYSFGVSFRYVVVSLIFWSALLMGLSLWLANTDAKVFVTRFPLIILIGIIGYYVLRFIFTHYTVTHKKIHNQMGSHKNDKKTLYHTEIKDMMVSQGLIERIFFNTGTLHFIPHKKDTPPLKMKFVADPYSVKQKIYEAWK